MDKLEASVTASAGEKAYSRHTETRVALEYGATDYYLAWITFGLILYLTCHFLRYVQATASNNDMKTFVASLRTWLRSRDQRPFNTTCPICYGNPEHPLITNCRHCFCGRCLRTQCQFSAGQPVECPMCRELLHSVQPLQCDDEAYRTRNNDSTSLYSFYNRFNRRYSLNLYARIVDRVRHVRLPPVCESDPFVGIILSLLLVQLYYRWPNDFIDDKRLFGYADDVIVAVVMLRLVGKFTTQARIRIRQLRR